MQSQRQLQLSLEAQARYIASLVEQEGLHHNLSQLTSKSQPDRETSTSPTGTSMPMSSNPMCIPPTVTGPIPLSLKLMREGVRMDSSHVKEEPGISNHVLDKGRESQQPDSHLLISGLGSGVSNVEILRVARDMCSDTPYVRTNSSQEGNGLRRER